MRDLLRKWNSISLVNQTNYDTLNKAYAIPFSE